MRAATSSAPGAEGDAGATVQGMETAACILASLIVIAFFGLLPGLIIVSPCTRGRRPIWIRARLPRGVSRCARGREASRPTICGNTGVSPTRARAGSAKQKAVSANPVGDGHLGDTVLN